MPHDSSLDPRLSNRRRCARVALAAPVDLTAATPDPSGQGIRHTGESINVSPNGLFVILQQSLHAISGELLRVSVTIPLEARRTFPFSRLSGLCRVVRLEPVSTQLGTATRVALAFCEEHTTRFSAAITSQSF